MIKFILRFLPIVYLVLFSSLLKASENKNIHMLLDKGIVIIETFPDKAPKTVNRIIELANEGFNLYVAEDSSVKGNFQHSGYFALIDQEGYLRSRLDQFGNPIIAYNGLEDDDLKMLKEDINQLL